MNNFSSGLNGAEHAELLRRKGLLDQRDRMKKKKILKKDILSGCLSLSMIYSLRLDREFSREEFAEILGEILRKNRKEQREEDKKKIESILGIGDGFS